MPVATSSSDPHVQNLTDQLNAQSGFFGLQAGDKLPGKASANSMAAYQTDSTLNFHLADSQGKFGNAIVLQKSLQYFTGVTRTANPPSTTEIPTSGGFGWHLNTSTGNYYFALNDAGSIVYPSFASISGNIQDIPGQITAAQHGNLISGTLHSFGVISGSITASQHGNQTDGGLHAAVVASGASGFMTGTDKAKLDRYPTDCTTVFNDSNAVQRSSGVINIAAVQRNGTQVVGARKTGYTNISTTRLTNASGINPATFDAATFALLCRYVATIADDIGASGHGLLDA